MNKFFINTILIIFLSFSNSYGEIINKIEVSGNKRISQETVIVLGQIELDKDFNSIKLNDTLKRLYDTDFFNDVSLSIENGVLKIKVIENPIIEDIEITGIRNKEFLKKITDDLLLKNRMSYSKNLLDKDIAFIKNFHKTNGFYFVKVTPSINKNNELNSVRIKLDIEQGNKAKIKEILFIGDKKFKDKKLLEIIASEEHKFWKFISNKVYLNENIINFDKRLLTNFYKNEGYYNVQVLDSFAELNEKGSFKVIFNINSGEQYFFNKLALTLPEDYKKEDFNKINKIFKKIENEKYSINKINLILKEIDNIASRKLYDFIDADVEEKIVGSNKIDFNFKIKDSQKFYVERVNIFGNFNTFEEVIRNKLIVDEGDPLNEVLYNKSINRMRSIGIFKSVSSEIVDGSSENLKIMNITVEEQPTGEISMGAGYGTSGSTIGAGITEKNFLGKGINLNTNFEITEDSVKGKFIYSKPNFNYTDNTLFTSVLATTTDNLDDFGYKVSETGFTLGTRFEQYENLFFNPEISLILEDLETNSTASTALKKQEGSYNDFYFNYGLSYDLRDSGYRPTSGHRTYFYQTLPIVSDNNEISNIFTATKYKTLNETSGVVGKASFYVKSVHSITDDDVRISKRAQVPYNRLRGFEKGKVGPVDNNDFIGGNYVSALNLSTNLPGLFPTIENMDFSYFIDVANVWGVDYSDTIDDSNGIRSSTGISLDFLTVVGPLSFSWTAPITKESTDRTETFRFNLGTTF